MKVSEQIRQAQKTSAMELAKKIRAMERLPILNLSLPGADRLEGPNASKYVPKMQAAIKKLEQIKKLIDEYNKIKTW